MSAPATRTTPTNLKPPAASPAGASVAKLEPSPGLDATLARQGALQEWHLTLRPQPQEEPSATVHRLAEALHERQAVIARQEVFGSLEARDEVLSSLARHFGDICWPVTYIEGNSCASEALSGIHVLAVAGAPVETVSLRGCPVGRTYRDGCARHLLLGNLLPWDLSASNPEQARQVFENLAAALQTGGMGMENLARTWLFLDDVLAWYGPFNAVRTSFYQEHGVFDRMVPASTGISGRNGPGAALLAGAWAVERLGDGFVMGDVPSPRQCPAPCYGSSFSRAVELASLGLKRLLVSGTASIAPGGASVGGGDVEAQMDLTMQVVRAILVSREMDFSDVSRATAYFKRPQDARLFEAWRGRHGLASWPILYTEADICRDELLFEIEVDALAASTRAA